MISVSQFFNAVRFLSIVPVPDSPGGMAPDWMARSIKYFPVVGLCIGAVSAFTFLLASELWGPVIGALVAVATSIALTGAMHEDGIADTFDSFGGGFTVEKRLLIMKDSRIGTYGTLALGIDIALRVAVLAALPPWAGAAALVAVHAAARATPGFVINQMNYAGNIEAMKVSFVETPVHASEWQFALAVVAIAAVPLAIISPAAVVTGLICGAVPAVLMALWARRLIKGYTGDVLGAIEQVFEIGFLLGVLGVLNN